jgi:hypothetical protein
MTMPNYAYPPDPKSKDPWYREITARCEPFTKKFLDKASELFGPPTKPADMPVRVTLLYCEQKRSSPF